MCEGWKKTAYLILRCLHALGVGLFLDNAHRVLMAVQAAKKQLRKELKSALAAMTKQQRQEESAILTTKVMPLQDAA